MTETTIDSAARAAFIAGFRALAEFLDAHPGLPVPRFSVYDGLTIYLSGSDAGKRAEVDRIAGFLQVTPDDYGFYQACRQFCGSVTYRIVAVPESDIAAAGGTGEA
ncbi:MAG: hypothetical protein ACRDNF_22380 [Streptosporangiaceae bacterium]